MQGYNRDPRSVARRAEEYLKSTEGDQVFFIRARIFHVRRC